MSKSSRREATPDLDRTRRLPIAAAAVRPPSIIDRMTSGIGHRAPTRSSIRTTAVAVLLVVGIASGLIWSLDPSSRGDGNRPNFVLIVTDDQRWDTLAAMPAVRRLLVEGGVTFRNAFVTTPSCCPSRASILSGQYSHTTGVLDGSTDNVRGGAAAFEDASSLATWLHDDGYRTGMVGKYLNDYLRLPAGYVPPGWDEWFAVNESRPQIRYYDYRLNENGAIVRYGNAPSEYSTSVLQGKAVDFVRQERPFFLYFAPLAPHLPAVPAPGDAGSRVPPWSPPSSFDEDDVSDKPGGGMAPLDRHKARTVREQMFRSLRGVDRAIAAISDAVEAAGGSDDTYFVFTSDNGYLWGEHRITGKVWPYEESIRVPLVIRPPGRHPTRTLDQLALNIDIAPTIAELAGIEPRSPLDGRSLVPLLSGTTVPWRSRFVVEFLGFAPATPPYVGVRTERYLYVEYGNGWRELYDLRTDPFQLTNLIGDRASPRIGAIVRALRGALTRMIADARFKMGAA
jgi:N-acetylglucosamine-6-sulfatase